MVSHSNTTQHQVSYQFLLFERIVKIVITDNLKTLFYTLVKVPGNLAMKLIVFVKKYLEPNSTSPSLSLC